MRSTESWKLWLIMAITFLLLVGNQYWAVQATDIVRYGRAAALKGAAVEAFGQLVALLVPVALVLVAGLTLDRVVPPIPG